MLQCLATELWVADATLAVPHQAAVVKSLHPAVAKFLAILALARVCSARGAAVAPHHAALQFVAHQLQFAVHQLQFAVLQLQFAVLQLLYAANQLLAATVVILAPRSAV
jgi:hypothetical protein